MLKNQHKSVVNKQSGWLDSNQRPHAPQTRTLTGLSYIPNCECKSTSFLERDKFFPHFFTFSCKKCEVFLCNGLFFRVFGPISTAYWSAKRILPQSDIEVVWTFMKFKICLNFWRIFTLKPAGLLTFSSKVQKKLLQSGEPESSSRVELSVRIQAKLFTCRDCTRGANISASTAVNANVGVDWVLFAFRDGARGAFIVASAACDAFVANYVSHNCK